MDDLKRRKQEVKTVRLDRKRAKPRKHGPKPGRAFAEALANSGSRSW